ncbi:MAG: hypothetical protein H6R26_3344 [Proteobacteria bacterium]|nr:hypothetical protein [Pseudomonadota bacterium]
MDQSSIYQRYEAVLDQANARWRAGEHGAGVVLLRPLLEDGSRALSKWPNYRLALALLAACLAEAGQFREALEYQADLFLKVPGNAEVRDNFVKMIGDAATYFPDSRKFQEALLGVKDRLDLSWLVVPLSLMLMDRPEFRAAFRCIGEKNARQLAASLLGGEFSGVLQTPILQSLMHEVVIPVPDFERSLIGLRTGILMAFVDEGLAAGYKRFARREKMFLGAFAHYAWLTEYAFCITGGEVAALSKLESRIVAEMESAASVLSEPLLHAMNVYALYHPLEALRPLYDRWYRSGKNVTGKRPSSKASNRSRRSPIGFLGGFAINMKQTLTPAGSTAWPIASVSRWRS